MKNWWLYVLRLEEGKYYVGITSQTPEIRMQEHINHVRGANWTKKYKPVEITSKQFLGAMNKSEAEKTENIEVRTNMRIYGLNNVRGGDITKVEDYSKFMGYLYFKHDIEALRIMIFLLVLNLIMIILYALK